MKEVEREGVLKTIHEKGERKNRISD